MSNKTDDARQDKSNVAGSSEPHALRDDGKSTRTPADTQMTVREQVDKVFKYLVDGAAGQLPDLSVQFPQYHLFWAVADNPSHPQSAQNYFHQLGYRYVNPSECKNLPGQLSIRNEDGQETIRFNELVLMFIGRQVYEDVKKKFDDLMRQRQRNQYQSNVSGRIEELRAIGGMEELEVTGL